MKRYVVAGRTTNRPGRKKAYKDIRFSGWTKTKSNIIDALNDPTFNEAELKRYVRYAISEAEAAAMKLTEYQNILEQLNRSNFTPADKALALHLLESTSLSQKDLHM